MRTLVGIISANRPRNVGLMSEHLRGVEHRWYVPKGQAVDYRVFGAENVVGVPGLMPMKVKQLNTLLADARLEGFDFACNMDDDLATLRRWDIGQERSYHFKVSEALTMMESALDDYPGFHLAGPAPTPNAMHVRGKPSVLFDRYPAGQFALHRASIVTGNLWYDATLEASEDWDMFLQHQAMFHGTVRLNHVLCQFSMVGNDGGFQAVNRSALDRQNRERLAIKWPTNVTYPHPKKGYDDIEVRVNGHSAR